MMVSISVKYSLSHCNTIWEAMPAVMAVKPRMSVKSTVATFSWPSRLTSLRRSQIVWATSGSTYLENRPMSWVRCSSLSECSTRSLKY